MSRTQRKPRPLSREARTFRDDRLFIVACDDTYAPKQYFEFFRMTRIRVEVIAAVPGEHSAQHVLNELLKVNCEEDDERWLLLDTDHYIEGTHLANYTSVLQRARQCGIHVALSRPCFELWLLLHHAEEDSVRGLNNAAEVTSALRSALGGQYNKTNLREADFPAHTVSEAYQRCRSIDSGTGGGDIPAGNTTRIYKLWEHIAAHATVDQLPLALQFLKGRRRP